MVYVFLSYKHPTAGFLQEPGEKTEKEPYLSTSWNFPPGVELIERRQSERFNCILCWRKSATRFQIINHWGNLEDPLKMDWLRPQTEICHKSPRTSSASPLVGVKIRLTIVSRLIFLPRSVCLWLWLCIFLLSYQEAFVDIIEEDEIAEHGDETQKSKSSHNVDHNIFQIELSLNCFG